MSQTWGFFNPVALRFGPGCLRGQGAALPAGSLLLVTTAGMVRRGAVQRLQEDLGRTDGWVVVDTVTPNPEVAHLESLRRSFTGQRFAAVIGFGGGSAVDTAKVLATLLEAPDAFDLRAYLEGRAPQTTVEPVPVYAIPTTSGTGAEVTPFATVWAVEEGKKFSFASSRLYPRAAWLDPEYTASLDRAVTISTGLDAFSQSLESIWNRHTNPYTLMLATRGATLAYAALRSLAAWPPTAAARAQLMEASLLAGLAISHTRTALAHSMSYPLTATFGLPHGLACSFTLPTILRYNAGADDGRLITLVRSLGANHIEDGARKLDELFASLDLSELLRPYLPAQPIPFQLVPNMFTPGRSDNNLRPADTGAVEEILAESWRQWVPGGRSTSS